MGNIHEVGAREARVVAVTTAPTPTSPPRRRNHRRRRNLSRSPVPHRPAAAAARLPHRRLQGTDVDQPRNLAKTVTVSGRGQSKVEKSKVRNESKHASPAVGQRARAPVVARQRRRRRSAATAEDRARDRRRCSASRSRNRRPLPRARADEPHAHARGTDRSSVARRDARHLPEERPLGVVQPHRNDTNTGCPARPTARTAETPRGSGRRRQ